MKYRLYVRVIQQAIASTKTTAPAKIKDPPPSPLPSILYSILDTKMATSDKYDRQLRLWGGAGQRALGSTTVVLIGSAACGTETLKNLVLPGVATFVIVDDGDDEGINNDAATHSGLRRSNANYNEFVVKRSPALTDSMLKFATQSSNFFLPTSTTMAHERGTDKPSHISSNAAQASALLSELNPDVHGYYMTVPSLEYINFNSFLRYLMENPPSSSSSNDGDGNGNDSDCKKSSNQPLSNKNILVVSADQPSPVSLPLSHACYVNSIPLILVRSYGLIGYVRIQTPPPYHPILDARPTHRIPDLRLSSWPLFDGLHNVVASVKNLDDMTDTMDHSHVPFVIILLQALEKWRTTVSNSNSHEMDDIVETSSETEEGPKFPETMTEKEEFRRVVKGMAKNLNNEINFEEALRESHMVWADGKVSEDVKMVLDRVVNDEESFFGDVVKSERMEVDGDRSSISATTPTHVLQFQLLALALKRFLAVHKNYPPLEGTIPDMTSDTARYVSLQEAYKQRAEEERLELRATIVSLLEECHRRSDGSNDDNNNIRITMPSDEDILTFCKNSRYLRILETRPYFAEYPHQDPDSPIVKTLAGNLFSSRDMPNSVDAMQSDARDDLLMTAMDPYETDPIQTPLIWWIALRACDAFYDRHQHYPGKHDQELALEADANEVYNFMIQIVASMGLAESDFVKEYLLDPTKGKDLARELARYDEAEIHTVAAVVGGVASQEAVKLITGQYVPLDDTYVYNGIASTAGVYRF